MFSAVSRYQLVAHVNIGYMFAHWMHELRCSREPCWTHPAKHIGDRQNLQSECRLHVNIMRLLIATSFLPLITLSKHSQRGMRYNSV